jgi:hypothetical protein
VTTAVSENPATEYVAEGAAAASTRRMAARKEHRPAALVPRRLRAVRASIKV